MRYQNIEDTMRIQINNPDHPVLPQENDNIRFVIAHYCECCGAELLGAWRSRENDEKAKKDAAEMFMLSQCPVCGSSLVKKPGYFAQSGTNLAKTSMLRAISQKEQIPYNGDSYFFWCSDSCNVDRVFEGMLALRAPSEKQRQKKEISEQISAFKSRYGNGMAAYSPVADITEIKEDSAALKKYILHLVQLENNIFSLEQQLASLYHRRLSNARAVVFCQRKPAFEAKMEIEKLRIAYRKALEAVSVAEAYQPEISVEYPDEPVAPVLGKPSLFKKKKVLEENDALTAKYRADLAEYEKEVRRCDEEKARLITEECAAVIGDAQGKADAARIELDNAERDLDDRLKAQENRPAPVKAIKNVLDKEIAEAEELLKKTFAARNALYSYDIIFGKYRNAVALSSFYEYLISGRCSSLEGSDGAYNIFENEIRMNRVISQLDTVISSLEDIKQNQFMMYEELRSINESLDSLNYTMDQALTSIRGIEANTIQMNEYMEHISQNSDVIAHNTAVSAYYSKINAPLTNALGYMMAFK